jgi:hypothetical protein
MEDQERQEYESEIRDLRNHVDKLQQSNITLSRLVTRAANELPDVWDVDNIQFPRLIAEIVATQDNLDLEVLAESMDLTTDQIKELMNRAVERFDEIKGGLK